MRWLLGLLLAVLGFVTVCVAILVYLVPDTAIERHILAAAGRATNSTISSTGLPEIRLFPTIEMTLNGVEMQPDAAGGTFSLEARKVTAEVSWASILMQWTIDIAELKLVEPKIRVLDSIDAREAAARPVARRLLYSPPAVVVRQIGIENGALEGIADWRIKSINAVLPSENFGSAMDVDVDFFLNGEKVVGNVKLEDPAALQSGGGSALLARLRGESGTIDVDGVARLSAEPYYEGKVALSTADLDAASRWLGYGAAAKYKAKPASLEGAVSYGKDAIRLSEAAVSLVQRQATVSARLDRTAEGLLAEDVTLTGLDTGALGLPQAAEEMKSLTARFDRLRMGAPADANLTFEWNGQPVAGTLSVPDVELLLAGPEASEIPLKAGFDVPGGRIAFDGTLKRDSQVVASMEAPAWVADGRLEVTARSAREMAALFVSELPAGDAFVTAELAGDIRAASGTISLGNARGKLDETAFSGSIGADWSNERPAVTAALELDRIDTARYLSAPAEPAAPAARSAAPQPGTPPFELQLVPLKESLEAHLARAGGAAGGPAVRAPGAGGKRRAMDLNPAARTAGSAWSRTPLGLEGLRDIPADVALDVKVDELRHGDIVLGRSDLSARLETGRLDVDVREIQPVEGRIGGKVRVDANAAQPGLDIDLDVAAVPIEKVLQKAGQPDVLRGKMTGKARLKASGNSEAEVVGSLSGTVTSEFRDGAIVGYDIRRALRPFASRDYDPRNTTPYERIVAKFEIADGLARSNSISLDGPSIRVRGDGTADLKTAALDYNSQISLVPPPPNFSVPVKIEGTWDRIEAVLDWARLASQWTGESPFPDIEIGRRLLARTLDPELKSLIDELMATQNGKAVPPVGVDILGELTGR